MSSTYNPQSIEEEIQKKWEKLLNLELKQGGFLSSLEEYQSKVLPHQALLKKIFLMYKF